MHAWVVRHLGSPDDMEFTEIDPPEVGEGLIRIAVRAAAVNFFDALQLAGTYQIKPDLPFILGAEVAGIVVSAPPGSSVSPGDRVLAQVQQKGLTTGGYTELTDAEPSRTIRIPDSMPFAEAAAFFINYQTGWFGLHRRAVLQRGETLLVHAGAGGVGSAAIQLGKAAGATVIATAGTDAKVEICLKLGADFGINYTDNDFIEEVKRITAGMGADVIYDPVGGDVFDRSTRCIAFEGRLIVVGFTSGRIPELRTNHVLVKNYCVLGLHWGLYRQRSPELVTICTAELLSLYRSGNIKPHISLRVPLANAPAALAAVASRRTTGKVVLDVGEESSPVH